MFASNFLVSGWTQAMSSNEQITVAQLSRLVGLPDAPAIIDVRIDEDVAAELQSRAGEALERREQAARELRRELGVLRRASKRPVGRDTKS